MYKRWQNKPLHISRKENIYNFLGGVKNEEKKDKYILCLIIHSNGS